MSNTLTASDLLSFGMNEGTADTAKYVVHRYALTIRQEAQKNLRDLHALHGLVMMGLGTWAAESTGRHDVLFAAARSTPTRTKGHYRQAMGSPQRLLVQAPHELDYTRVMHTTELGGPVEKVEPVEIRGEWRKGDRLVIKCFTTPEHRPESNRPDGKRQHKYLNGAEQQGVWFRNRLAYHGAHIEPHAVSIGQPEFGTSGRGISYTGHLFQAEATIQDPEKLASACVHGIGRGRSYGLGLLLTAKRS